MERSILNILEQITNDKKNILVFFDETKINKNLKQRITDIINNHKANNNVDFFSGKELENAPKDNYNIVLEFSFTSLEQSNSNRKYLISNFSYEYKNQYFSFVNINATEVYEIFKIKLQNINRTNIVNICSNYYSNLFFNSNKLPLYDKIRQFFEGTLIQNKQEAKSQSDSMSIEDKKKELFQKYDKNLICDIVELIKNNADLKKEIFHKFIKNKEHLLWKNKNINASMIDGKKGYITVKMIPPTKQREE